MTLRRLLSAVAIVVSALFATGIAQAAPSNNEPIEHLANGIEIGKAPTRMRVTALTDSILRVRIARNGVFAEDASWAVSQATRKQAVSVRPTADGFRTNALIVHVNPLSLQLSVTNNSGQIITSDEPESDRVRRLRLYASQSDSTLRT